VAAAREEVRAIFVARLGLPCLAEQSKPAGVDANNGGLVS